MSLDAEIIGRRLAFAIDALGKNQADVCREVGFSTAQLSQYCTGRRVLTLTSAIKLREAYGLTLDYLFFGDMGGLPTRVSDDLRKHTKPVNGPAASPPPTKPNHTKQ